MRAMNLRQAADRACRGLSAYDCRRHYATLCARDALMGPRGLSPRQRAAVDAGIAAARRAVDRERAADLCDDGDAAPMRRRFASSSQLAQMTAEERAAFRSDSVRRSAVPVGDYAMLRARTTYRAACGDAT